jgi:ABC-type multidrug transport system fused ATPase/permease subunit
MKKVKKEKKRINFKYNFKEYWSFVRKRKWSLFLLVFAIIITELLFVLDKFLFKRIIDDAELFVQNSLALDIFIKTLIIIAVIFLGVVVFRSFGRWWSEHILIHFELGMMKDLKKKYFGHILTLSHNFHTTHKSGSLISRLGRGQHSMEAMTDIITFQFFPLLIQLILVSVSLAIFSITPMIVVLIMSVVFISYSFLIQRAQEDSKLKHNSAEDSEKGFVSDIFTNIESIKYFGKEKVINSRFEKVIENTRVRGLKNYKYFRWFGAGQFLILGVGTFFLMYFPVIQFLAGEMTLGTLVFIFTLFGNVAGNLFGFVWGVRGFYRSMADFQDLFGYGKIKNEIKDKPNAKRIKIKNGAIKFDNITFDYGQRKFFKNFNLEIKPNEKIALVGHSGCGKTTIVKLLNRLYDVKSGRILIDGKDIRNFKQRSVREETGIVPQEAILFDDTIYNNIKFANNKTTKEEVWKAIKFAQLDKIIKNLPNKENTIVGERGVKLSGGEKQRVSIARAILANKKILVLDEATSALDSETEHEIQKDMKKLLEGRTSIIIAHRLSTIMSADRIIVMKEGKIIEQGKHSELIRKNGEYKRLWGLQKGGYLGD